MAKKKAPGKESASIEQEKAEGQEADELTFVPAESFTSVYSNNMRILLTKWDVRIRFGEVDPEPLDGEAPRSVQKVEVVMSHPHYEKMLEVLNRAWEKKAEELKREFAGDLLD